METWAWRPELKPGNPRHHAELMIGKPEVELESCMEFVAGEEQRSWTTPAEMPDPGD